MSTTTSPRPAPVELGGQAGVAAATDGHAQRGDEAARPANPGWWAWWFGVWCRWSWSLTLTVEPEFKSSGEVDDDLMTIGEVGDRAGVATSTVRYYERRGLLAADARRSGQRRYRTRDACAGWCSSACCRTPDWRSTTSPGSSTRPTSASGRRSRARRLDALDDEIERLERAQGVPRGRAAVPLRSSRDRLQGHGRRDRPPTCPVRRCRLVTEESSSLAVEHDGLGRAPHV